MGVSNEKGLTKKIDSLQALRCIAFLGVASSHCGLSLLGAWSVSVFFVLSGFLMMHAYQNRPLECSLKNNLLFALKKIKKLYPLYLITTIAMIVIQHSFNTKVILIDLFLVQSWFPKEDIYYSYNGVAWFCSDMLFIYFMFPVVQKVIGKFKHKKSAIITILTIVAVLSVLTVSFRLCKNLYGSMNTTWLIYVFPISRLWDFVAGCCLYYIYANSKNDLSKINATFWEIIAIIFLAVSQLLYYYNAKHESGDYLIYFYLPSAISCVYLFTIKRGVFTKLLCNKIFIFIGNFSGYAFLLHRPVMEFLYKYVSLNGIPHRLLDIIVFSISVIISIGLAVLYQKTNEAIQKRKKLKI